VLGGLLGGAALLAGRRGYATDAPEPPHYFVLILLHGGFDAVLTVDPKDGRATTGKLDPGYRWDETLRGATRAYGPLFGPLMRHERSLAFVHGVRVDTVGHIDGSLAVARGRITSSNSAPLIGDLIGTALPGRAPLPHVNFALSGALLEEGMVGPDPLVVRVSKRRLSANFQQPVSDDPIYAEINRVHAEESAVLSSASEWTSKYYRARVERTRHLRRMLAGSKAENPFKDPEIAAGLLATLQAIEGDHARYLSVYTRALWFDSHTDNVHIQRDRVVPALRDISLFLTLLGERRNACGPLIDQTTVLVGSELGRYPKENVAQGKDHWPENSWIVAGRGIRPGVTVGGTDDSYRGLPTDFRTGSTTQGERRPIFLDDLFGTMLHLAGGDLAKNGFERAHVIEALLSAKS
jgi:hypothetical protein